MDLPKKPLTHSEFISKVSRDVSLLIAHHEARKPQENIIRHKKAPKGR